MVWQPGPAKRLRHAHRRSGRHVRGGLRDRGGVPGPQLADRPPRGRAARPVCRATALYFDRRAAAGHRGGDRCGGVAAGLRGGRRVEYHPHLFQSHRLRQRRPGVWTRHRLLRLRVAVLRVPARLGYRADRARGDWRGADLCDPAHAARHCGTLRPRPAHGGARHRAGGRLPGPDGGRLLVPDL